MNIDNLIETQFADIEGKRISCKADAEKYKRYANRVQFFVLFMGIITPIIVIFRQKEIFPPSFWVVWCIITPPLTAIISFLATHFEVKEKASRFGKMEKTMRLLLDKAKVRFANTKSEEDKTKLYEYIIEKIHRIEEYM